MITKTTREMTKAEAKAWLDGQGLVSTRLPRKTERLEILTPSYTQHDITTEDGATYALTTTRPLGDEKESR